MESYSVETMSGSFLSKFCVENWGDYSLKSSRGPKTRCCFLGSGVLLFFSSSISQPLSTPFGGACRNIGPVDPVLGVPVGIFPVDPLWGRLLKYSAPVNPLWGHQD